MNKKKI